MGLFGSLFGRSKRKDVEESFHDSSASTADNVVSMPLRATGTDSLFVSSRPASSRTNRNEGTTGIIEVRTKPAPVVASTRTTDAVSKAPTSKVTVAVEAPREVPAVRPVSATAPAPQVKPASDIAPSPIVDQFSKLPDAVKMYGARKKDGGLLSDDQKHLVGALIHEDGKATLLITREAQRTAHTRTAFIEAIGGLGKIRAELVVAPSVLASAYAHYGDDAIADVAQTQKSANSNAKSFAFDFINRAMEVGASDIHLEIRTAVNETAATLKFRVDGDMEVQQVYTLPAEVELANQAAALLFQGNFTDDRSRSNTQKSSVVQQHALVRIHELRNIALRYQTVIDKDGYDLVLRVLTYDGKAQSLSTLEDMGLEPDQIAMLVHAVSRPYGASFLGGSTGSGKTTLMAALMAADPFKHVRKRYTAEDPVEIDMPDVTQVSIPRSSSDTSDGPFTEVLKGFLRGDPDLAMVGEIRERATASVMMQLALTGHNIWATLHINRMFDALIRLTDPAIGVELTVLGSDTVLNLLSSQTLVKRLCSCAIPVSDAMKRGLVDASLVETVKQFGVSTEGMRAANVSTAHNRNQCPHCAGKGERGRALIIEMALIDAEMKDLIREKKFDQVERVYRKRRTTGLDQPGMAGKTMLDHAMLRAARGEICVNRLTGMGVELPAELAARKYKGFLDV